MQNKESEKVVGKNCYVHTDMSSKQTGRIAVCIWTCPPNKKEELLRAHRHVLQTNRKNCSVHMDVSSEQSSK